MTSKNQTRLRSHEGAYELSETDFAQKRMGNNKLQGDDQEHVRNQRKAVPGVKKKTEGVVESFEKMDGEARVSRERNRR